MPSSRPPGKAAAPRRSKAAAGRASPTDALRPQGVLEPAQPPALKKRAARRAVRGSGPIAIDLALQGGGAHGAFTWGVLDRLLENESIAFDGVSGTSAGALNAAVLATGWADGGRAGARAALHAFWRDVGGSGSGCFGEVSIDPWAAFTHFSPLPLEQPLAAFNLDQNPGYVWLAEFLRHVSPYQFGAHGPERLGTLVRAHVREDALRGGPLTLFVTATAVQTGRPRVFTGDALSIDALLASSCLPQLFRAVSIDGEPYWDGGYSGNPALWPLIYQTAATDLLLVKVSPLQRAGTPETAAEIADRVNEITFNAGLVAEMRAIHFVQRLLADGRVDPGHYKALRLHMVADDDGLAPLGTSSKMNTDWRFLQRLHTMGRAAAERWLGAHRADLGRRSTLDLDTTFLAGRDV
ncbi:MAG: patatin-like phospholipase family protein [Rubrivivax sp.]